MNVSKALPAKNLSVTFLLSASMDILSFWRSDQSGKNAVTLNHGNNVTWLRFAMHAVPVSKNLALCNYQCQCHEHYADNFMLQLTIPTKSDKLLLDMIA